MQNDLFNVLTGTPPHAPRPHPSPLPRPATIQAYYLSKVTMILILDFSMRPCTMMKIYMKIPILISIYVVNSMIWIPF